MNRERRLIRTIAPGRKPRPAAAGLAAALALAAAGLSGCISDPFSHPVAQTVAGHAEIEATAATPNLPYPRWSKFPATPTNVPTVAQFAAVAQSLDADQAELLREAAALQWTLSGTEAWAAEERALIDPTMATPAPPNVTENADAFAAAARAAAAPPPPVK